MSTPRPHSIADLALAPVLIKIERNLDELRDSRDLLYTLALELNDDAAWYRSPARRADRIRRAATRGVDLHGWDARPAPDLQGLVVQHGDYRVTVMFGKRLTDYIRGTAAA
jgi:hypothetical protein